MTYTVHMNRGYSEDTRMEVLLHDPDLFIAVYTPQRVDIEYEGDLTDFSIESNLASPLEAKSRVLLDTSL